MGFLKIKKLIILLFFLLLAPFEAVLSKKNPVIDKIELFTEGQVDKKTLERNLVLMIGKPVYSDDYYRAIQEATSSGDIGGMEIKVSQDFLGFYVARIHVKPVPILSEIILEGNWPISPNQVLNQLRIKENQSFWENRIKERKPILQEYLGKIGYPENQVSYTLKEIKKNHFNLFLKLNIGRACTIKTVNLIG